MYINGMNLEKAIEEFAQHMQKIVEESGDEIPECHEYMDNLMCHTLKQLGFDKGIEIFEGMDKWYA